MLNLVGVALWIPAVVLAADHWLEKRRPVVAVALMGLMGLQFLVGFLQVSLYLLFALFAYPVLERRRGSRMSTRRAARVVAEFTAMTLGGAALAAVQLLPHFELIARSHREAVPAVWRFVNWEYLRHLISLISPDHFGSPVGNTYHGALNYTEMCGYVGLLPALAALAGACRWGRRGAAYFSAVAFGALLVYLETPLNSLLWYVVPGYRLGIGSTRIVCLLTFAIAGLAGIGFDGLVKGSGAWRRWRYALCSVVFLLSFVELERFGRHHLTSVRESTVYPAVEAVDFMRRTPGPWRMMSTPGVFPPNSAMAYGLEAVEGYESLFPRRYREYMTKIDASVSRDPNFHGIVLSRYDSPLLDLLNVRFLVTDQQLSAPDLRLVYEDGVRIYERASALPRAFVVWRYRRLPDPRAVLDALGGADFRPAEEVLLEDEPQLPGVVGKGDADVRFEAYEAGRVTLRARLSAPGLLILADSHYPGWEVRVDGRPRSILVADYILRSVALDAGAHRVEFVFRPWSFWLGSVISTAAFFGILAAVIAYRAAGRA